MPFRRLTVYTKRLNSSLHGKRYDAIVVGGGHNGLVAAAYLAKAGKNVVVIERRPVLGGAAVTEEIVPGFKFSRCSYVLSLLRPYIIKDLELKKHGLKVYLRNPTSYTPVLSTNKSLALWHERYKTQQEIAKFSTQDAEAYPIYEDWIGRLTKAIYPLIDNEPPDIQQLLNRKWTNITGKMKQLVPPLTSVWTLGKEFPSFFELVSAPASKIVDRWFVSEPLRATLATDAIIGAVTSPRLPGSGYVLLHHVMGETEGRRHSWSYVEGGMGGVSSAIAASAKSHGAEIVTGMPVNEILVEDGSVVGVKLEDDSEVRSSIVLSNATPHITYMELLRKAKDSFTEDFIKQLNSYDYSSQVTKINVALSGLPSFKADPSGSSPLPHHQATIHINTCNTDLIHKAYEEAQMGHWSSRPMIEMCIPSVLDPTLAPKGNHVATIFTQYTPYTLNTGPWTEQDREAYANTVFDWIEEYAPGFRKLIIDKEVLTPQDLERIFGLTGGNIFHGAMSLDQLYLARPTYTASCYRGQLKGMYLCGSGSHPGGGVMGACGHHAAQMVLNDMK
ncbi:pyridine nucleotide-disulfide oxidoreductase domain-containing protein 2-like [Dysidea avara]|uniref:pyridine nucleotide-disulfide oxidoreductase domain-containing protein 2-like n=1 Tax=Dysidea avara TaxID=196820 RepID=UPI0033297F45